MPALNESQAIEVANRWNADPSFGIRALYPGDELGAERRFASVWYWPAGSGHLAPSSTALRRELERLGIDFYDLSSFNPLFGYGDRFILVLEPLKQGIYVRDVLAVAAAWWGVCMVTDWDPPQPEIGQDLLDEAEAAGAKVRRLAEGTIDVIEVVLIVSIVIACVAALGFAGVWLHRKWKERKR